MVRVLQSVRGLVGGAAVLLAALAAVTAAEAQLVSVDGMFQKLASDRQAAAAAAKPRTVVRPAPVRRPLKQLDAVGSANRAALMPLLERVKPVGLPLGLAAAVVALESGWRIEARGAAGEIGLMQIKPETAVRFGDRPVSTGEGGDNATAATATTAGAISAAGAEAAASAAPVATATATADAASTARLDLFEPETNLRIGTRFLDWCYQRARHDVATTIGCYNAGPSKMKEWHLYPTTRDYVSQVHGFMAVAGEARMTLASARPAANRKPGLRPGPRPAPAAGATGAASATATAGAAAATAASAPFVPWLP